MKKYFLLALVIPTFINASTNKTYLNKRPQTLHANLFYSIWKDAMFSHGNITGSAISFSPILGFSDSKRDITQHFTFQDQLQLQVGRNLDIDNRHIKFNETSTSNLTGTLKFAPYVTTYGIRIDYYQSLEHIIKNWFLEVNVPIVQVNHNLDMKLYNGTASSSGNKTILDYFAGEEMLTQANTNNINFKLQEELRFGKIKGNQTKTGVGDIGLAVGKHLIKKNNSQLNVKGTAIFITSTSPSAEFLFEPSLGTGGALGLGLAMDGYFNVEQHITAIGSIEYKYIFSDDQKRLLGLKDRNGNVLNWGQYNLLGKIGYPLVLPAANVLRQVVNVQQKGQLETLAMISTRVGQFIAEAGYNVWYRQKESVKLKSYWDDTAYAMVGSDYASVLTNFNPNDVPENTFSLNYSNLNNTIGRVETSGAAAAQQGYVLSSQLDTKTAETPSVLANKIFFTLGYEWPQNKSSYLFGGGMSYEFASGNAGINEFMIWLKLGLVF